MSLKNMKKVLHSSKILAHVFGGGGGYTSLFFDLWKDLEDTLTLQAGLGPPPRFKRYVT